MRNHEYNAEMQTNRHLVETQLQEKDLIERNYSIGLIDLVACSTISF